MKPFTTKLLLALAAIYLFACRKDDRPAPEPPVVKNVKQITWSAENFVSYEYNAAGQVTRHVAQWPNGAGSVNRYTNIYTYDAANQLTRWSNEAGNADFVYRNGVLEKSTHYATNGRKLSDMLYTFKNRRLASLIEQVANPGEGDVKETKVSFTYLPNGNVQRIDYAWRKELNAPFTVNFSKVFVAYDDRVNPEPDGVLGVVLPGVVLPKNNPLRVNNVLPNSTSGDYIRFEYRYNSAGLPEQKKQFIAVNNVEAEPIVATITY